MKIALDAYMAENTPKIVFPSVQSQNSNATNQM